jgi:hypothetical protein
MTRMKSLFLGSLFSLILFATIALALLVVSEVQLVRADEAGQPAVISPVEEAQYAQLVDATPRRDITGQRLAPLE